MKSGFKLKIENEKRYLAKLKKLTDWGDILESAAKAAGFIIVSAAQRKAPVDTGNLRNSISLTVEYRSDDLVVVLIVADTEYAIHVEFGTRKQKAQPYMRPAITNNTAKIERVIAKFLIEELKKRIS